MPVTHHVKPESGDVLLLVGTMKGAFILRADAGRATKWEMGGPYFPGSAVYAHGLRRPRRPPPHLGRAAQHALGRAAPLERRLRPDLDRIPRRRT